MGLQVPRRVHTEGTQENAVWAVENSPRRGVSRAGAAQGKSDRRGPSDGRPCAHDDLDTTEVCGVEPVGYIKGKSEIHLARVYSERKRNFAGQSFWARGYFVSTVGRDEELIRNYIREQEREDERLDQLGLWR